MMSSKAFIVKHDDLVNISSRKVRFNYSHSDLEELLESIGRTMPYDTGGLGIPLVIYSKEIDEMEKNWKEGKISESWGNIDRLIDILKRDSKENGYVLYYLI